MFLYKESTMSRNCRTTNPVRISCCPAFLSRLAIFVLLFSISAYAVDIEKIPTDDTKKVVKTAQKLVRKGDLASAEILLKQAAEAKPNDPSIKLALAFVYVKMRRLASAYDLAFPVVKDNPRNSYGLAVLGATYLGAGRFNDARILFFSSIKADRSESLAWAGLGLLDFYENNINESIANLQEAVFTDPNEADYLYALAQVAARAEKYNDAAKAYEDFLRVSRNDDDERRARIRGLISFLRYLGGRDSLYETAGADSTQVPFELIGNRPIIKLKINGKPNSLNFVLDTGSGISVISNETAKALGIRSITKGGFAKGIGGDGKFEIVYGFIRQVGIGDVTVRNVPVYIRKFHSDAKIDGYIGLSLISKFLTTIDYGAQTFDLQKKTNNAQPSQENAANAMSVPLRLTSSGFLSGEVKLEGVDLPLNFIVDTGASVSVISHDIASLETMMPNVRDEKMRVIGSAGITEDVPSFMLPKISFGSHTRKSITAIALDLDMINEASGFQQSGILGGNFLKNYRMTFDFKNSRVTFVSLDRVDQ